MVSLYLPGASKIGSGYQAHEMAEAMIARGHRVTMFSPCPKPPGATYQHFQVAVGNSLRTFRFAWNLRRAGLEGYDVVHAHGDDYWLWGKRWPAHVRTMHGSCFAEAGHVPGWFEKLRMLLLGLSEVAASFAAGRTACVSRDTLRYYPWVKQVIPNGVDLARFRPGHKKEPAPTILFVGTYHNRKRGRLLMDCFEKVVLPALSDAQLWMVCSDAPAAPNVTRFGTVSKEKLAELYSRSWLFCLPSSYEGFGVPYIEAMASGTAVVATANPGAMEVLDGGRYGRIAREHELGEVIVKLLTDDIERKRLAQLGLARAQEFGWDRIAAEYEELYSSLIERCRQ